MEGNDYVEQPWGRTSLLQGTDESISPDQIKDFSGLWRYIGTLGFFVVFLLSAVDIVRSYSQLICSCKTAL